MTSNALEITEFRQYDGKMCAVAYFSFSDDSDLIISASSPYGNIGEFDCATLYRNDTLVSEVRSFGEGRNVFYSPDESVTQNRMAKYWIAAAEYSRDLHETHPQGEYRDLWDIASQGGAIRKALEKGRVKG